MSSHADLQQNGLKSLINYNDRNDTDMNDTLQNGDLISGIGLLNSHILPKDNSSGTLNDMNMSVDKGDINGDSFYMNSSTGYESKNHNFVDYTKKIYEISTNRY